MNGRGLGASLAARPRVLTRGSSLQPRLDGLDAAVEAARGRLDEDLLDEVQASVARSTERLKLSAAHTIVAIAGSTGSGKSTLFNALAGAELSTSGAQRPTTSTAKALVWSDDDVPEVLDWLGVPETDRHARSTLRSASSTRLPEGLVLLDLPDHDSVKVTHHDEAERIVGMADLLIWVVDPQKYADAAIHHRFLQPLAGHRAVTMVVLNHVDTVPEERRAGIIRDLRRLLVADGIRDPRILATSARHGTGLKELRAAIRRRVEEKENTILRVEADIRSVASRLEQATGDAPPTVPETWVTDLERRVAGAAGVAGVARAARRAVRERDRGSAHRLPPLDRSAVDTAVRTLVDNVCRDLTPAWGDPIRAAATEGLKETDDRLDGELAVLRFQPRLPGWFPVLRALRAGSVAFAAAAALLVVAAVVRDAALTVPLALLVATGLLAAGANAFARSAAERAADNEAAAVEDACRRVIARVVRGHVVARLNAELATYARFHRALTAATR